MTEKRIGKIQDVRFGHGGYQDAMIGISFTLGSDKESWNCGDFWGEWATKRSKECKWTEQDRIDHLGATVMRINKLLDDAKVSNIQQLVGKPIEITFEGQVRKEWRILTEAV